MTAAPSLELPVVGGNCAYVARGDRRSCSYVMAGYE